MELSPARSTTRGEVTDFLSTLLGGHVSCVSGFLELLRRGSFRVSDQLARSVLLRNWNGTYDKPRTRSHDGRLWHARCRPGHVLHPVHDPRSSLVGARSEDQFLVSERRACLD